jgi:hypothetical protein
MLIELFLMPVAMIGGFLVDVKYTDDDLPEIMERAPESTKFTRLPFIRHYRAIKLNNEINAYYDYWAKIGSLPYHSDRDYRVAKAIWNGDV